jgi:DNA-binding beta-propeller fold protein YncE
MNRKWKFAKAAADRISGVGILQFLAMFLWVPFGAVSAAGQTSGFVYVANNYSYDVSAYTIDGTTGGLTFVSGSPFSAGTQPVAVTVDPTGKFVYVVNYDNVPDLGNISAYTINGATGALTAVPGSPFPAGFLSHSVTIDSTGHFAYVANAGSNNVSAYTIDGTTGALTAIPGSPFPAGSGPASVAVDPAGHFAYVANCGSFCVGDGLNDPGNISAYIIDATTGALTAVPGSPFPAGYYPDSVAVLPSGRFLYVTNCGNGCAGDGAFLDLGSVSAYSIDATTGALTAVPGSPFPAGYIPMGVAATVGATLSGNSQYTIL